MARLVCNRNRKVAAVIAMFVHLMSVYFGLLVRVLIAILLESLDSRPPNQSLSLDFMASRGRRRRMFMDSAIKQSDDTSHDIIRVNRRLFWKLCEMLTEVGGLKRSKHVDIDEMVVMFLFTLAHNKKNRVLQFLLCRSGETVHRQLHKVLSTVLKLHHVLLVQPIPIEANSTDPKWKYFKNCLGALDGTHIKLRVGSDDQPHYRDRKGDLSMNVLGVCNPNLEFIYCLAGWEGSTHDGRVLRDAISRPNGLKVPKGNYYLCDVGYTNGEGFLTPFRGQRYHLKKWGTHRPNTAAEYFNMKHSSARNTIERAFGVLKMRWAILRDSSWFKPSVITKIVNACCLLHNFIKREEGADRWELSVGEIPNDNDMGTSNDDYIEDVIASIQPSSEWNLFRNTLAEEMWENRSRRATG